MEINSLFGIPAHPLLVHAAVVLVPLAAIGTAVIAVWGRARRALGWVVVGVAFAAFGAVGVAQKSGGTLADHVVPTALTKAHVEMGDAVLPWAFAILGVAAAVMVIDTWRLRRSSGGEGATAPTPEWLRPVMIGLGALAIVFALGASVQVYRVGHSGAKAVWQSTDMNGPSTGGGEAGG